MSRELPAVTKPSSCVSLKKISSTAPESSQENRVISKARNFHRRNSIEKKLTVLDLVVHQAATSTWQRVDVSPGRHVSLDGDRHGALPPLADVAVEIFARVHRSAECGVEQVGVVFAQVAVAQGRLSQAQVDGGRRGQQDDRHNRDH
ncbi:hypothetical protein HPB48_014560 [Haemaphysalis longicornis]|uniref:Uncharacterized protein n=1 Tax=Haemaphysalis longicornis TaxID=44386 RepID=A0A9J6G0M3_HAELO|nr:hypothetical protein HPB48_014560 [Haemaphysalis longicornis]